MGSVLPDDVLLLIGEQLEDPADRWNLVFASRHFHDLFLPLAYRTISLHDWRQARSFLHAITNRPSSARAVREFVMGGWSSEYTSEHDQEEIRKSSALSERIKEASHSANERIQWQEDLSRGFRDAWAALILPSLSQLRELDLDYTPRSPFLDRVMQRAIAGERPFLCRPAFQHLRQVTLRRRNHIDHSNSRENEDDHADPPSSLLLRLFQLPSVWKVFADSVVDLGKPPSNNQENNEQSPAGFSPITDIDIRSTCGSQAMYALIASCANLKSFKYQHSDSHVLSQGYQPTALYKSLAHSKVSLETLWLDQYGTHHAFTAAGLNQTHDEWFGSLADFTALRDLRIRLPNLLDIRYQKEPSTPLEQCLPPSLEKLFIEGCKEQDLPMLVSQLQTVVRNRHTRVPNLQYLHIEGATRSSEHVDIFSLFPPGFDTNEDILEVVEPLHRDCIAAGIDLHLHDRFFAEHLHCGVDFC